MFENKWLNPNDGGSGGAGGGQGTDQGTGGQAQVTLGGGTPPLQFEAWIKDQKPDVVGMLDVQVKGLKTALDSEREIRKDTEKQLRDLAKKAEKGSEAEKKLTEMADQFSVADRRADFYEEAHKAGVANLKLAFLVATEEKLFDSKNRVNFEAMKKDYPELFGGTKMPEGDAGSGTEGKPEGSQSMDTLIRKKAGRST
jgi:hypothetical protein